MIICVTINAIIITIVLTLRGYRYRQYSRLYKESADIYKSTCGIIKQLKLRYSNMLRLEQEEMPIREYVEEFLFAGRFSYGRRTVHIMASILEACLPAMMIIYIVRGDTEYAAITVGVYIWLVTIEQVFRIEHLKEMTIQTLAMQLYKYRRVNKRSDDVSKSEQISAGESVESIESKVNDNPTVEAEERIEKKECQKDNDEKLLELFEELFV